jgi:hypothetical protein
MNSHGLVSRDTLGTEASRKRSILLVAASDDIATVQLQGSANLEARIWGIGRLSGIAGKLDQSDHISG